MKAKIYARVVALAGLGILLVMAKLYGFPSGWFDFKYLIFLFLMLMAELFVVQVDNARLSMEYGTVYAAGFIFGLIPAAVMKALSTFFSQLYIKWSEGSLPKEMDKVFFNVGQYMISFFGGAIFYMGLKKNRISGNYCPIIRNIRLLFHKQYFNRNLYCPRKRAPRIKKIVRDHNGRLWHVHNLRAFWNPDRLALFKTRL